jgi:hypothetical protein
VVPVLAALLVMLATPTTPAPASATPPQSTTTAATPLSSPATNTPPASPDPDSPKPQSTLPDTDSAAPGTNSAVNTPSRADRNPERSRRTDRRRDRGDSGRNTADTPETTATASNGTDYDSFRLIPDRNIFNVNRSGGMSRVDREPPRRETRVDTFALVGSMSYPKGDFAFFDGSSSEFRRVLKTGDTIAGFTVQTIAPDNVQLAAGEKSLNLAMGSHLRREEQGEWTLVAEAAPQTGSSSSSSGRPGRPSSLGSERGSPGASATTNSGATPSSDAAGGSADDVLQRLMKKREQEMQ